MGELDVAAHRCSREALVCNCAVPRPSVTQAAAATSVVHGIAANAGKLAEMRSEDWKALEQEVSELKAQLASKEQDCRALAARLEDVTQRLGETHATTAAPQEDEARASVAKREVVEAPTLRDTVTADVKSDDIVLHEFAVIDKAS